MRRSRFQFISALLGLVLCLSLGVSPTLAAGAPAPAAVTPGIADDLATELQNAAPDARIPVLIEATPETPLAGDRSANQRRAGRAADVAQRSGGRVRGQLAIVGSAAADLTPAQIRQIASDGGVARVTLDRPVRAASVAAAADAGSGTPVVYQAAVGAPTAWQQGYTGRGIGVAILDSGIANDPALDGRVVTRVDFVDPTAPAQGDPGGHGTHVAGIVGAASPDVTGVAPQSRLLSVRVLDAAGNGRLSSVIRGLEWTIAHKTELGIRVVVLALGAPTSGSYQDDPLASAAELAWRSGLVVVAAAGNNGPTAGTISTPGVDPLLLTVGATDDAGTAATTDDSVPFWSSRGPTESGIAKPDLVAPGRKIVSLRVPGSTLDQQLPTHIEGPRTFRLSGTSEATAVVAGTAALLLQQRPDLDPDAVKALLVRTAQSLPGVDRAAQGSGSVNIARALQAPTPTPAQARQNVRPSLAFMRALLPHLDRASLQALKGNRGEWNALLRGTHASWDHASWDHASWDALLQEAHASWDHASWDHASWDHASWDHASWDHASWDAQPLD
ncbi:MAG TPA: S8 family peptidase [Chloroflexota bacterium]